MAITEFVLYMDVLPYMLGTLIIIVGASKIKSSTPLHAAVVFTTIVFILAQSSWSSAWMSGNAWGRDWANVVWFIFNTSTMVIFACILLNKK